MKKKVGKRAACARGTGRTTSPVSPLKPERKREREREREDERGGRNGVDSGPALPSTTTTAPGHRPQRPRQRVEVTVSPARSRARERAAAKRGAGRREEKGNIYRERGRERRKGNGGRGDRNLGRKLRFSGRWPSCLAVTLAWLQAGVRAEGGSHDGEKNQERGSEEGERDGQRREGKERKRGWLQCGCGSRWLRPRWLRDMQLPGEGRVEREREREICGKGGPLLMRAGEPPMFSDLNGKKKVEGEEGGERGTFGGEGEG